MQYKNIKINLNFCPDQ